MQVGELEAFRRYDAYLDGTVCADLDCADDTPVTVPAVTASAASRVAAASSTVLSAIVFTSTLLASPIVQASLMA